MTRLGGVIGAILGFLLPFVVSDRIDALADNTNLNDYVGTAIGVVFAVGGWVVGTRTIRRLKTRSRTTAH